MVAVGFGDQCITDDRDAWMRKLDATPRAVIAREEHYLERKFENAYRAYKERVRRWCEAPEIQYNMLGPPWMASRSTFAGFGRRGSGGRSATVPVVFAS
jgi:hypothetical protein